MLSIHTDNVWVLPSLDNAWVYPSLSYATWQPPHLVHRLYSPGPFYAAKLTTTLPFNLLIAVLFTWIGYGMFGYRHTALALVQVCVIGHVCDRKPCFDKLTKVINYENDTSTRL